MADQNEHLQNTKAGERVAKVIARSGLCSRREAEGLIEDRRVSVNGALIESAALDISPSDKVLVDGKPLSPPEAPKLWRYHKPKGRVTTHKDPEGRPTVFEALPDNLPRLISIGRLDFNTEGLLLLTNDGDLARHLELPSTGWTRRYRVRAYGEVSEAQLQELAGGFTINRVSYGPIEASLEREQGDNVWISISIREGKNREVRRILEHLGLTVNRLIRISFGPFMLGDLEPGQIEEVKTAVLKDQLGPRLSRQLGVRREVMREERSLTPGRAKPTYLRRKPVAPAKPERPEWPERPLKRRRIFEQGGVEAPKVEFVAERKPGRFNAGGERGERPPFSKGGMGRREGAPSHRRVGDSPVKPFEARRQQHGETPDGPRRQWNDRDERAPAGTRPEGQSTERRYRERPPLRRDEDASAGRRPDFQKRGPDRAGEDRPPRRFEPGQDRGERRRDGPSERPPRRFSAGGDGGVYRDKPREERGERPARSGGRPPHRFGGQGQKEGYRSRSEGERPPRRFAATGERAARSDKPREDRGERATRPGGRPPRRFGGEGHGEGDRSRSEGSLYRSEGDRPPRRFATTGEGAARSDKPREERGERTARPAGRPPRRFGAEGHREGDRSRSEGDRPPRRFAATGEGAARSDKPREERGDRPARPGFRRKPEGERTPYKARDTSASSGERAGAWKGREKRPDSKPSGHAGKPPRNGHGTPPRKPAYRPRPGTDKETP